MSQAYQAKAPVYLRMGKSDRGDVHAMKPQLQVGSLIKAKSGKSGAVVFIASGSMVRTAMDIAIDCYPDAAVWSAPFIKPIDSKQVAAICAQNKTVIVLEEHSVLGGLGSVVTEISAEFAPVRILRIGVQDRLSHKCGSYEYLLQEHGLDRLAIERRIIDFLIMNQQCA
jgi:transketolase